MHFWSLTTARHSMRMTLKWARLGTSCVASSRAAGRSFIRENRPICEAGEVGSHLVALLPAPQTNRPCHSHLLMLPWVQTRVRGRTLIFDPTFGSALHLLIPTPLSSFPPLVPHIRGAEMRSFWTESQKKKKKKKRIFPFCFIS